MSENQMFSQLVERTRKAFNSGRTKQLEWRENQLRQLIRMLEDHEKDLTQALYDDLHKHAAESLIMEVVLVVNDAVDALENLHEWTKPQKVKKGLFYMMDDAYIQNEPLGVVLNITAWNYPVQIAFLPLIGAIAAGNCCILKPSEISVHTAKLLAKIIPQYLDKDCIHVVNGGIKETTALLEQKFDHIMYTGSGFVGKIIMQAAAKHLTPVTLELGGKSPCYVHNSSDLDVAAKRLLWGKFCNAGQTCIAVDYVLVDQDIHDKFVSALKVHLKSFYGENPKDSDSLGRIVSENHFNRVKSLLSGLKIVCGGNMDESTKYIEPTIVTDVSPDDKIMQSEIFGPLLPILTVSGPQEAIEFINQRDKPLALYVFCQNRTLSNEFIEKTSSGAILVNDTMVHGGLTTLPFGGVGPSGFGSYHGKFTFDALSHRKSVLVKKQAMESINKIRYPPYSDKAKNQLKWIMKKKPKTLFSKLFFPILLGIILAIGIKMSGLADRLI